MLRERLGAPCDTGLTKTELLAAFPRCKDWGQSSPLSMCPSAPSRPASPASPPLISAAQTVWTSCRIGGGLNVLMPISPAVLKHSRNGLCNGQRRSSKSPAPAPLLSPHVETCSGTYYASSPLLPGHLRGRPWRVFQPHSRQTPPQLWFCMGKHPCLLANRH